MKKNRKEKSSQEASHSVKTPTPPQVMDPSAPPTQQNRKDDKKQKLKNSVDKNKDMDQQKLPPIEELWWF